MTTGLVLATEVGDLPIALDGAAAPRTTAALLACLPLGLDVHCAKIAGNHIFWHAPFVCEVEAATDVLAVPTGGFLYWPERQFLELVYAPLQAETAAVTVLGRLDDGLDRLLALGRLVQDVQGHRPVLAELRAADGVRPSPPPSAHGPLAPLSDARRALWAACPEEVDALMASRGVMHPAGPLLMAEGEARGVHELLWWHRRAFLADGTHAHAAAAALALEKAASRIGGFCHLTASAGLLLSAAACLAERSDHTVAAFDEAILIAGRLAGWLDLRIPWTALTEATRTAHDRWSGTA
ncbi:hypothetical protein [Arenibaculum sp.]|uniref:hypothetical protein n=1 Tax=Arenibaculum sp. TaxID=2865862 RepID=UPI002E148C3F|nr:hypothetical protein [Arenibaculum sp.]